MVEEYYDNIMIYDIDLEKKKQLHVLVNHYFQRHCGDIVISYRFTQTNHGDISPTKRMNPDDFYNLCRIAIHFPTTKVRLREPPACCGAWIPIRADTIWF
jgi:hypothetical protein